MARILLIDDDELLRDTVHQMLELDGHQVTEAADGGEGLRRFAQGRFDLVITDVLMPQVDGAQVIVELRRSHAALPILAISGGRRVLSPEFNLHTADLAGATHRLAKPFGRAQLQQAVAQALGA
ncbi:response regulator transcription factor [Caldimonas tepidiphila]|uniref:response regulator transcription factor n=1 Tax=Caldimonas tepidiphila TaxID=2315841 RepID=UPI000E5A802B|nr:response regulator [Caldimonas tepidiphila]